MGKKVSVVVPNYNNEKYLKMCIESICMQIYSDLEIIIVDDCSTDHSADVLHELQEAYGDKNLKVIFLEKNSGVSHARNVGLGAAKGKYITFLDADDCWADGFKLGNEISMINKYEKKGIDVAAYSRVLYMDEKGQRIENRETRKSYSGNLFMQLLNTADTKVIPRDYCVKTEIAREAGGYREDMSLYEDYEFTLRLAKKIDFMDTEKDGTVYRLKSDGLSDKSWKVSDIAFYRIFREHTKGMPALLKIRCYMIKLTKMVMKRIKTEIYNIVWG